MQKTTSNKADILSSEHQIDHTEGLPPPYHVFKVFEDFFVFVTATQLLYSIDEPTFCFLRECLTVDIGQARKNLLTRNEFSAEIIDSVAKEVELLAQNGLFECPDYRMSNVEAEKLLKKRYERPISSVILGMAESCNLACVYCYCGRQRETSNRKMNKEVARDIIDWLFRNSGDEKSIRLTFFGGEPLLNKPVIQFSVEYSQKLAQESGKKVRYNITTNATLIDDELADLMKKYSFNILVSLDGPEEVHNLQCPMRGGKGSFEQTASGAKRVLGFQKDALARSTVIKPVTNIKNLIDFYRDFGFSHCFLGPAVNSEEAITEHDFDENDYLDFNRQNEAMIPEMLRKMEAGDPLIFDHYGRFIERFGKMVKQIQPANCGAAGTGCLYVNVDGFIYPCHHFYGYEAWCIGSIYDGPVNTERLKDYWRKYRKAIEKCDSCWAGCLCQGPCSADLMLSDGNFSNKIRFCDARRFVLERGAYMAYKKSFFPKKNSSTPPPSKKGKENEKKEHPEG